MVITNIYLRLLFGFWAICLGLVLLKIYGDKEKVSIWQQRKNVWIVNG